MRSSGIAKYAPVVGVVVILACAAIDVYFTIQEHSTMLTALPLGWRVAFVLAFWGFILLVGVAGYFSIRKHSKK